VGAAGAMFAAAEDFSHLIDNDLTSSSSLADVIGTGAVSRHDNAGTRAKLTLQSQIIRL